MESDRAPAVLDLPASVNNKRRRGGTSDAVSLSFLFFCHQGDGSGSDCWSVIEVTALPPQLKLIQACCVFKGTGCKIAATGGQC